MREVTIIGAGVVGLCSAFFLQQAGFSVLLLDEQPPAEGCSKGNAGHFATEQVFPLANFDLLQQLPSMLVKPHSPLKIRASYLLKNLPWFCRFISNMPAAKQQHLQQALSQLNGHSIASWQKLAELCDAEDLIKYRGALLVSESDNGKLEQTYQHYRQAGIAVQLLNKTQTLDNEPALSRNLTGALDFTEVAHTVEPWVLCQRIFAAFLAAGGQWQQSKVKRLSAGKVHQVETEQHTFSTHCLVIAAGAYSNLLTRQLGWSVPLAAERGYHLMVNPVALSKPVSSLERKFIMTPMQQGLRIAGTVEFAGLDAPPDYRRVDSLLFHANKLLHSPFDEQQNKLSWFGNRPSLPDSLPVLGPCPQHKNIYYNFGHQHLGLTQAAYCAELLLASMTNPQPDIRLKPYRIDRFGKR